MTRKQNLRVLFRDPQHVAAEVTAKWTESLAERYAVPDTTPWVKGVIHGVPKTYSVEKLREKIEKTHGDVLLRGPIALVP